MSLAALPKTTKLYAMKPTQNCI